MNIDLAIEIVKDHIRIGKGMELTNQVPEALEMIVDELEVYKRALELACDDTECVNPFCMGKENITCSDCTKESYIKQAKEGVTNAK